MNMLRLFRLCFKLLVLALLATSGFAGEMVPVLKTRTETLNNVTLVSRTSTHVFIQHSRGMATLKLADIDAETLHGLGVLSDQELAAESMRQKTPAKSPAMAALGTVVESIPESIKSKMPVESSLPPINKNVLFIALGVVAAVYLLFCYCAMLICKKAGTEPGLLVWIPLVQVYPLVRAAGMSGWWSLAWFVPLVNIVAQVMWCIKIAQVRGKGMLTSIMLILPVTGLFAFLYLAFSGGSAPDEEEDGRPLRLDPLPV